VIWVLPLQPKASCTGAEKVTQQRGDRRGRDVLEDEALTGFGERKLRLM
jgi:hypothetical protein